MPMTSFPVLISDTVPVFLPSDSCATVISGSTDRVQTNQNACDRSCYILGQISVEQAYVCMEAAESKLRVQQT